MRSSRLGERFAGALWRSQPVRLGLTSIWLAALPGTLVAQTSPSSPSSPSSSSSPILRGRVVSRSTSEPVAGVTVRIENTSLAAQTNAQGRFAIAHPPAGRITLVVEGVAIETLKRTVRRRIGAPLADPRNNNTTSGAPPSAQQGPKHLTLEVAYASLPQYTTTVAARGAQEPQKEPPTASTTRLSARALRAVPRRNAEDALRSVPGLALVQHGSEGKGHQFFLRGFDAIHGADLEVSVAGLPINEWSNVHAQGYIDLGFVIPEAIRSVNVVKGPFTLTQGAFAMAGSAHYALGIPKGDRGLRASYSAGTTNRHRGVLTYSPAAQDGRQFLAIEALHDDGFGQNRSLARGAVLGRLRLIDSKHTGTLSLLSAGHVARFALPGSLRAKDVTRERVGFYEAYDRAGRGLSARGLVALRYRWRTPGHAVHALAYAGFRRLELLENFTGFLYHPIQGDRREQFHQTWRLGAKARYTAELADTLSLRSGVGIRTSTVAQRQQHIGRNLQTLATELAFNGVQALPHAWLGVHWRPSPAVQLSAGARAAAAHVSVDTASSPEPTPGVSLSVTPRLTARWRAAAAWQWFAAYGRGYRPPHARAFTPFEPERTGFAGERRNGPTPRMSLADALELGVRWRPLKRVELHLAGFATLLQREAMLDHVSGITLELNSTRRLGAELGLEASPFAWLRVLGDVTYVDARFVASGNPIPLAPWLVGHARAIVTHPSGLRAGLQVLGMAPRPLPHGARGAPLTRLDATLAYHWERVRLSLGVENLLNQRLREGEYHYASHWRPNAEASALPVIHFVAGPPLNARLSLTAVF